MCEHMSRTPREFSEADEKEREALKGGLKDVGRNLPNDPVDTEGSDVDHMVRHEEGADDGESTEDEVIRQQLAHPHPDVDRETAEDLELTEDEDEK